MVSGGEGRIRHWLRESCRLGAPDLDADVFANACVDLARAQRELGRKDPEGVFRGALEVCEAVKAARKENE
jgi:hypothetical protein